MRQNVMLAGLLLVPLTGCYSLLVVNLGVVNKVAAANATALDPEVACAALAPIRMKVESKNAIQPNIDKDWIDTCHKILEEQQQKAVRKR